MARKIEIEITGDTRSLERALGKSQTSLQKVGKVAKTAGLALAGGLFAVAAVGFKELADSQKVMAQTEAVLKSTGGVAKVTAGDVSELAGALSEMSGVDDEVIQGGENILLTFKGVRNELGKGNDIFNQATEAALDMSVAMGMDLNSAALNVGKALNDPITGVAKLQRVGVTFTDKQKKLIESLVETGDVAGAQKIILEELRSEFGGSAEAAGETLPGKLAKLRNSFEETAGKLAETLLPVLETILKKIETFAAYLEKNPEKAKLLAGAVGVLAGALLLASVAQTALNIAMLANPIGAVVLAIAGLIAGLTVLYVKSEKFRAAVNYLRDNWNLLLFAFGVLPGVIATIIKHWDTLEATARSFIGFFRPAWNLVVQQVRGMVAAVNEVIQVFRTLWGWINTVIDAVERLISWIGRIDFPSMPDLSPGFDFPVLDSGGIVPGRRGSPQLILAHGGETVLPTHKNRGMAASNGGGRLAGMGGRVFVIAEGEVAAMLRRMSQDDRRRGGQGIV